MNRRVLPGWMRRRAAARDATFEIGEVAGDDAQAVVVKAEDVVDHLHLGDGAHGALEIFEADAALGGEFHAEEHRDAEPQRLAVEIDPAGADDPFGVEPFHAAPRGGLREAETAAQLARRQGGVFGQRGEEGAVGVVEVGHRRSSRGDIHAACRCSRARSFSGAAIRSNPPS